MSPIFPIMILGGLLLTKPKSKKMASYQLIETGSMSMLPKDDQPKVTVDLRRHQMLEIVAASSPAATWVFKVEGASVKIDRKTRMQDPVTQTIIFEIKAQSVGDSQIVFEKLSSDGKLFERRYLNIAVMG